MEKPPQLDDVIVFNTVLAARETPCHSSYCSTSLSATIYPLLELLEQSDL